MKGRYWTATGLIMIIYCDDVAITVGNHFVLMIIIITMPNCAVMMSTNVS